MKNTFNMAHVAEHGPGGAKSLPLENAVMKALLGESTFVVPAARNPKNPDLLADTSYFKAAPGLRGEKFWEVHSLSGSTDKQGRPVSHFLTSNADPKTGKPVKIDSAFVKRIGASAGIVDPEHPALVAALSKLGVKLDAEKKGDKG